MNEYKPAENTGHTTIGEDHVARSDLKSCLSSGMTRQFYKRLLCIDFEYVITDTTSWRQTH